MPPATTRNEKEEGKPAMKETMRTIGNHASHAHHVSGHLHNNLHISSFDESTKMLPNATDVIICLQCTSFQVDGLMSFLSMQSPILLLAMSCVRCKKMYVTCTLICVW